MDARKIADTIVSSFDSVCVHSVFIYLYQQIKNKIKGVQKMSLTANISTQPIHSSSVLKPSISRVAVEILYTSIVRVTFVWILHDLNVILDVLVVAVMMLVEEWRGILVLKSHLPLLHQKWKKKLSWLQPWKSKLQVKFYI